ncbi:HNH endonuclease [Sporomusa malonica]|uniref:HNH endonuclease n=1 Tax=Sporomusa malonica TaxID=112901 RepID=UPI001594B233|nr:HNH endonuclease signature motif containing protein [Sporomusa malonica]
MADFRFSKWQKIKLKNEKETPYTSAGRNLYQECTQKRLRKPRDDDILTIHTVKIKSKKQDDLYNFEYFLNRAYALNRDRFRCRVCGNSISKDNLHFHHVTVNLPLEKLNRVPNLATVHWECHAEVHDTNDYKYLGQKVWKKILRLREKLHK